LDDVLSINQEKDKLSEIEFHKIVTRLCARVMAVFSSLALDKKPKSRSELSSADALEPILIIR
jgi:hypothetical protein